tara:strand:+ start:1235 stop:1459 length:225 start_codon:yes stop_codon:yes gene_type:complete
MDDKIFNFGDLVKLSPYGEAVFENNPVGRRFLGKNGIIVSEIREKINMVGYNVKFAEEDIVFLGIDEIMRIREG